MQKYEMATEKPKHTDIYFILFAFNLSYFLLYDVMVLPIADTLPWVVGLPLVVYALLSFPLTFLFFWMFILSTI